MGIIDDLFEDIIDVAFMLPVVAVKWVFNFFEDRAYRKRLLEIEKLEDMQKLHWREFERFISFVLQEKGFKTRLGEGVRDGWIDIEAVADWRKYLIQCKKWHKYTVSEPNIREFLWAISDFDIDAKWIYITTSNLTSDANAFAERNDIEIWDKYSLEKYVSEYTGKAKEIEHQTEEWDTKCTQCWGKLVRRVAKHWFNKDNAFLGCENYPRCKTIINL